MITSAASIMHAGIGGIAGSVTGGENGFAAGALGGAMAEQSSRFIDPHSAAQQQAVGVVSATAAMFASGGSVKAMTSAQTVSVGAIEYNRELHDDERTVANVLKKGKTPEEQHIIDGAASAAVKMNKSVPDSDQHKAAINDLVEIGKQHPEVQAALRAKAIEMGKPDAFVYSWGDSVADKAARFDEVTARGFGIAKAGLGSKWTMGSARAAAVSASTNTPAGYAIAGALGLATVGNAYYAGSGVQEAFSGYEHKEGARVLGSLTHHVPGYVEQKATSIGIDLAVGAMGYVTGATISMHVTRAALEAKYVGSAALSAKEVVSGASVTQKAGLGSVSGGKVGAAADATKAVKVTAKVDTINTRALLPGEGKAGTYGELKKISVRDGLDAHHGPNDQYMQQYGISKDDGIAILVRNELHREIHRKMRIQDPTLSSRDALAQSVLRTREVYQEKGLYLPEMRQGLQDKIGLSKEMYPYLFEK